MASGRPTLVQASGKRRGTTRMLKMRIMLAVAIVPMAIFAQFLARFVGALMDEYELKSEMQDGAGPPPNALPSSYGVVPPHGITPTTELTWHDIFPNVRTSVRRSVCDGRACTGVSVDVAADAGAQAWVTDALHRRRGPVTLAVSTALSKFGVAHYDVQAVMGSPGVFMWSTAQWREVLRPWAALPAATDSDALFTSLLDVGAGLGHVTQQLAPLFANTPVATEVTWLRSMRLWWEGLDAVTTLDVALTLADSHPFDVVAALNVLDRVSNPALFLESLRLVVQPDTGVIVISLPLPYRSRGTRADRQLPLTSRTFAGAAAQLVDWLEADHGMDVLTVSRAPYLCHGTHLYHMFALDAAVVIARPRKQS